jgi:hypothetical protein
VAQIAEKIQRQTAMPVPESAVVPMAHSFDLHLIWVDQRNVKATMKHLGADGVRDHAFGAVLLQDQGYDRHVRKTIESGICWRRIGARTRWRMEVCRG